MEISPFRFFITPENVGLYNHFLSQVISFINKEKDIPYKIVQHLLELMIEVNTYNIYDASKKADKLSSLVVNRFINNRAYRFKWNASPAKLDGKLSVLKHDWNTVSYNCIFSYLVYKNNNPEISKEETIEFFYATLTELHPVIKSQLKNKYYSHYKRCVIAGFFTQVLGYSVCEKNKAVNDDFFQACKNLIKDKKKP